MSGDSFLERWSRRKREAADEHKSDGAEPAPEQATQAADEIEADAELLDEKALAALPPVEEITAETDILPFLQRGIPTALKNAALRRMWLLNPAIRNHRDLAVDYAWDWNTPGGLPGSSGTISPESVVRFLRSLGEPEEEEQQEQIVAEAPPPAQHAAPVDAPEDAEQPANTEQEAFPAIDVQPLPMQAERHVQVRAPTSPPMRRRHGGATPS